MGCMVPKLVLQPIVENAVIHGVRDMDDGYIKIGRRRTRAICASSCKITDAAWKSRRMGRWASGVSGRPGEHLGMFNVDSILRLHFRRRYGLSVRSDRARAVW